MSIYSVFGVLSTIALLIGHFVYIKDISNGSVRPQRSTWFVIQVITCVTAVNQIASGNIESAWAFISTIVTVSIICFLAMRKGVGGVSLLDISIVSLALIGLTLWVIRDDQTFITATMAFVITLAVTPTFKKVYSDPSSENIALWLLSFVATIFISASVETISFESLLIPATWFVYNGTLALLVWTGQKGIRQISV